MQRLAGGQHYNAKWKNISRDVECGKIMSSNELSKPQQIKRCIKVEDDEWDINRIKRVKRGEADLGNAIVEMHF